MTSEKYILIDEIILIKSKNIIIKIENIVIVIEKRKNLNYQRRMNKNINEE